MRSLSYLNLELELQVKLDLDNVRIANTDLLTGFVAIIQSIILLLLLKVVPVTDCDRVRLRVTLRHPKTR